MDAHEHGLKAPDLRAVALDRDMLSKRGGRFASKLGKGESRRFAEEMNMKICKAYPTRKIVSSPVN